jgi:hemolysin activation/secretion protein
MVVAIDLGSGVKLTDAAPGRDVVSVEILPGEKPGHSMLRITPKAKDTIGQARIRLSTEPKTKDSADSLLFVLLR